MSDIQTIPTYIFSGVKCTLAKDEAAWPFAEPFGWSPPATTNTAVHASNGFTLIAPVAHAGTAASFAVTAVPFAVLGIEDVELGVEWTVMENGDCKTGVVDS